MRSAWVALVLVGFAVCAAQRADAGAIYKFKALPRLHSGMLELTFEGTRVSGQVLPHPDNGNRAVPITGANPADGVVELTFHFDEPETAAFKRSINGNDIVWTSSTSGDSRFWRPRYGEFSEAALILEKRGDCGPIYRSLKVSFREGTTEQQVSTFFGRNRDLAQLPVTIWADRPPGADRSSRRHLPLGSALLTLLAREEVNRQVDVPVGTEVTVATMLGKSGFMGANLTEGGCGGSDASFFTFDRSLLFEGDRFLKDKFVRLIEQGLHAFAGKDRSGRTWDYAMGKGAVSTLKISPFTSSYRVKMRMASEASRQVAGYWDSFDVLFEPAQLLVNTRSEYSVVVTVEDLRSTNRATGREVRKKDFFDTAQPMAEIEAALLVFLSRRVKNGWCEFMSEGIDQPKAKCSGRRPQPAEP